MGKVVSSKRTNNDNLLFEVEVGFDEATQLKGHVDNVHLFSEHVAEFETNISSRGKNSCTKYFLVPRHLRKGLDYKCPVSCQKIETNGRVIFIYVVDKEPTSANLK